MHELKIIQDIFPIIENIAKDNCLGSISKVILGIGKLRQVQSEFLQFAFATLAKDTAAEGAELIVNLIPVEIFCNDCKKRFAIEENAYVCPECESVSLDILKGKEVVLESVEGGV